MSKSKTSFTTLDRLTVAVLSKDRPELLESVVRYWLDQNVNVIVSDASKHPNLEVAALTGVLYRHGEDNWSQRLQFLSQSVRTDFVMLSCDDELYLPSAVSECILFLDRNPEFVACSGECVELSSKFGMLYWKPKYVRFRAFNLAHDSAQARVQDYLSASLVPTAYYGVNRVEPWRAIWSSMNPDDFATLEASETMFEILAASFGKIRVLPRLLWVRNGLVTAVRASDLSSRYSPSLDEFWREERFKAEKMLFVERLASISRRFSRPLNDAGLSAEFFEKVLTAYVNMQTQMLWSSSRPSLLLKRAKRKWSLLRSFLISRIPIDALVIPSMLASKSEVNFEELRKAKWLLSVKSAEHRRKQTEN